MGTIKGQNLRIYLNGAVITAAQECNLRIRANVKSYRTKDTVNDFDQVDIVNLSWNVTAESAVWTGTGPGKNTKDLFDYKGAVVDVTLAVTTGNNNAEMTDILLAGRAIVTDIRVTARNRDFGTCTIALTGKSDLYMPLQLADVDDLVFQTSDGKVFTLHP